MLQTHSFSHNRLLQLGQNACVNALGQQPAGLLPSTTGPTCIRALQPSLSLSVSPLPAVWHAPWHGVLRADRVTELAPA